MENKKIGVVIAVSVVVVILGLGAFLQSAEVKTSLGGTNIITNAGLHWHADLVIKVKGKQVEIPTDIGLGTTHNPLHTHENEPNTIHMEFPAIVRSSNLLLGEFFKVWKKDMRSFGTNMKMTVNGKENTEFENYQMKDKDKIVLSFD